MPDHQRKIIRKAIVETLTRKTAAVDRVFPTRIVPLRRNLELPAICVFIVEDDVEPDSEKRAPRELFKHAMVTIEGWVTPGENVDDAMDDLSLEIETAMHADPFFADANGACRAMDSVLEKTTLEVIERGDRLMGLVSLFYRFDYTQLAPEAPTNLDDFETVESTFQLEGTQDLGDVAIDLFTVEEP